MIYYIIIWDVLSIYVSLYSSMLSIWVQMVLEYNQSSSWTCWLRKPRVSLGLHNHVNMEMNWQAVRELLWRCTWTPASSELRVSLGANECGILDSVIEQVLQCSRRLRTSEHRDPLGGRIQLRVVIGLEARSALCIRVTGSLEECVRGGEV